MEVKALLGQAAAPSLSAGVFSLFEDVLFVTLFGFRDYPFGVRTWMTVRSLTRVGDSVPVTFTGSCLRIPGILREKDKDKGISYLGLP